MSAKTPKNQQKTATATALSAQDCDALFRACETGAALALESLLQAHVATGARKLPKTAEGLTPLMLAAKAGHAECVKRLLPHSSVLTMHEKFHSALILSLFPENRHHLDHHFLSLLLERGGKHGGDQETALILAAAHQGRPYKKTGRTPLMDVVFRDSVDAARLLLPFFDAKAKDKTGRTALMNVTENLGEKIALEMLDLLLPHSDIDAQDARGRTALMTAVLHHRDALAQGLLDAGADPALLDARGRTALMLMAKQGGEYEEAPDEDERQAIENILICLHQASSAQFADADGSTALILAVRGLAPSWMVEFFAKRIDPDARDRNGRSAFDWALKKGHKKALNILVPRASEDDIERLILHRGRKLGAAVGARIESFLLRASIRGAAQPATSQSAVPAGSTAQKRKAKNKNRL